MTKIRMTATYSRTTTNSRRGNVTYTSGQTYSLRTNEALELVRLNKAVVV